MNRIRRFTYSLPDGITSKDVTPAPRDRRSAWRPRRELVVTIREETTLYAAPGLTLDQVIAEVTDHEPDDLAVPGERTPTDAAVWDGYRLLAVVRDVLGVAGGPEVTRFAGPRPESPAT